MSTSVEELFELIKSGRTTYIPHEELSDETVEYIREFHSNIRIEKLDKDWGVYRIKLSWEFREVSTVYCVGVINNARRHKL